MSGVDVAAIREALKGATPGPWGRVDPDDRVIFALNGDAWPVDLGDDDGGCANPSDAELIVLLRNNAEALLDIADHVDGLDCLANRIVDQRDRALEALAVQKSALERAQAASEGVDMLVAQAERRGAVRALRGAAMTWSGAKTGVHLVDATMRFLLEEADAAEDGAGSS